MEWDNENNKSSNNINLSSKILLAIIGCVVLIILLIIMLLMNQKPETTFLISVDGKTNKNITKDVLLTKIDNKTYINLEKFASLVGYKYHQGEYKANVIEENKWYVDGKNETASFYLKENKVFKLPLNKLDEEYAEYTVESGIKIQNEVVYVPIETAMLAFNVSIAETSNSFAIYTLDYLANFYNTKAVNEWGYSKIENMTFENKKAILQGYLIVADGNGRYKIINLDNTKDIVPAKYTSIEYSENMQVFFVTNSSKQVGIINLDGTMKIEPLYEAITVLDKEADLYLIKQNQKYGVITSGNSNNIVIYPEYDSIGAKNIKITNTSNNKNLILDTLIPVSKDGKWGAYDKKGNIVLNIEYDALGYELNNVEINGLKKVVKPLLAIERCKGIVVKKDDKYGLISLKGKTLVQIVLDAIYEINTDTDAKYFMLYGNQEFNVIDKLISEGILEEKENDESQNNNTTNIIKNNIIDNNVSNLNNNESVIK